MVELPSGTVTFLFTDLAGSTRSWEEHRDEMRSALARHDEILRASVESHRGAIVKSTGDGIHAVFASARDGLRAAVAAQRALTSEPWHDATLIRVRMGLHSGEAEHRDGDYYGTATNRAARLMSAAHGGQVLVSLGTEELLSDELPGDVSLVDLGEHRLRDLTRAEHIYQVVAEGVASTFPPLRTLDAFPENLPLQVSSFVGREADLTALAKAFETGRLVTVIGVGGVGKTRLAIQVAADVITRYPDGAWFCELAAADEPDAMLQVVAAALGVQQRPGVSLDRCIVEALQTRRLLVVLDNCEHLIRDVAALVSGVVRECPTVGVLATSREALGVVGEQVWPLASLDLPPLGDRDAAPTNESVRLFVERATAARPGFALGPGNVDAVVEICRRLDGIPLAIELAAARVAALSPADLRDLLDERFRLLAGTRRSAVERHQTLRATVDWSYSLLEPNERVVFDRLGVFAGGFDHRAAQVVCSGDGIEVWDVLDALTSLVAKSMVNAEETDDGTMRYQLLETLRQYARERLDDAAETDRWRARHAAHYADVAEETLEGMAGPEEFMWRSRLAADLDNIRAALNWSLDRRDTGDIEYGLRIVAAIGKSNDMTLAVTDWIERVVPLVADRPPELRLIVVAAASVALAAVGDLERSYALAQEVLQDQRDVLATQRALHALIMIASQHEDFDLAYRLARQSLQVSEGATLKPYWRATPYSLVATYAAMTGELDAARQSADEGVRMARALDNPSTLATLLYTAGLALWRDEPQRALEYFAESAALARAGVTYVGAGINLAHLARLEDERGELGRALEVLDEGIEHCRRVGPRVDIAAIFAQICRTFARNGWLEPAAVLAGVVSEGAIANLSGPNTPERIARATTPARAQLGDNTYQRLYTRGVAMSYADAIDYARARLNGLADSCRDDS
jgi:predicted ATPase/class 3 adenylate cyclase